MRRILLFIAAASSVAVTSARAEVCKLYYTPAERAAIKAMPIEERPYRIGHVYGNTVRRVSRFQEWQQR